MCSSFNSGQLGRSNVQLSTKYTTRDAFPQIAQPVRGLYPNYAPEGDENEAQTKSDVCNL